MPQINPTTGEEKMNRALICTLSGGQSLFKGMQAYSDNQADVNENGFHLLLYISYLAIKRAEDEREGWGGSVDKCSLWPPPLIRSVPLSRPAFTSSLAHPPLLILPVPTRIGSM